MFINEYQDLQNKIQELAREHNIHNLSIQWKKDNEENYTAILYQDEINREIKFSQSELKESHHHVNQASIAKINEALSYFPDINEPPPMKHL